MWATFLIVMALAVYFAPAMVSASRGHNSGGAIFALNLLLGWTVLGWIGALVWAFTGDVAAPGINPRTHVKCPDCRELVLADAKKCKHCGTALVPQGQAPASGGATRVCPDCRRSAPLADAYCPACGHSMAG